VGVARQAQLGERAVERIGDVADRIDERAVEVEDHEVVHHAGILLAPAARRETTFYTRRCYIYPMAPKEKPQKVYSTMSGIPLKPFYRPEDVRDYDGHIGDPGQYPFTRGPHETMYRGKLWTMRMFAGFGTPEDTNQRFRFLLSHGQTGLSTAFDMPTLMGYDADHPRSLGEVGREGVSVSTLDDMERLFDGIPLDKVTTSMTVNCSASIILAMYFAIAQKRGIPLDRVGGTIQNDMLKEYIAQKEWICPPEPGVRIVTDMIEFCAK